MASWPGTLPARPLVNGSSLEEENNVAHAQADIGVGQTRPRYTAEGQFVTFTWRMSDAQVVIFDDWFHNHSTGIAGGAIEFAMNDPYLDVDRDFLMVPGSRPQKAPMRGNRTNVSMQLYRLPEA